MRKRLLVSGIGLFFLLSVISAREGAPTAENVPMGTIPTIDGVISSGEWTDANVKLDEDWHKPDIKGCRKPAECTCSDVQYRGLLDMTTDAEQDITGVGMYNVNTDETTVEIQIPYDSEDLNNYAKEYEKVFTVIYGSIHRSSSEREYIKPEPIYIPVPHEPQSLQENLDKEAAYTILSMCAFGTISGLNRRILRLPLITSSRFIYTPLPLEWKW